MEVFVLSRQSCECCLAHGQHHQLPTWSRRQVLALKNCIFPTGLLMMELCCEPAFPPGPVRHPGLCRFWSTSILSFGGKRTEFVLLPLVFAATHNSSLAYFYRSPFCQETEQSSIKKQFQRHCHWQLCLKARDLIIV